MKTRIPQNVINPWDALVLHTSDYFGYQILLRVTIFDIDCGRQIRMPKEV